MTEIDINPVQPIAIKRLSAAFYKRDPRFGCPSLEHAISPCILRLSLANGALDVIIETHARHDLDGVRQQADSGRLRLLVGDESELSTFDLSRPYGNLLQVEVDVGRGQIECATSLVGLPPLFVLESEAGTAIGAPTWPDSAHGINCAGIDPLAVADVLRWGHPIDNRTLAANLRLALVGARVALNRDGVVTLPGSADFWRPQVQPPRLLAEIVDEQISTFSRIAARMNMADAFVSLSGGLDSRAAVAGLLAAGRTVTSLTLALDERSLDAQLAAAFCAAHGIEHRMVRLGEEFRRGLADRVVETAGLTLGVSALAQSIDRYLYEQLAPGMRRRVSGNLGNQVGRGGVESLSAAAHPDSIFSPTVRATLASRPLEPWYVSRMRSQGFARTLFSEEVNYWSIPNYVLGSAFAVQQTPYADRDLIRLASELFSLLAEFRSPTVQSIRKRDLRHRFAGPPLRKSFQRQFLRRFDSAGRKVAINWGWLASGGWSLPWLLSACPTAISAALLKAPEPARRLRRLLPPFGLADWPQLVRCELRELTFDTLTSARIRDSGLFDNAAMAKLLDRHFSGDDPRHATVVRCLEIGLGCNRIH
jgi:hypothetical protein